MGLLLPLLLALLSCLIGGLYLLGVFRQHRPGEPPLDRGLIPWLGHVLEMRWNTLKFFERMKQKHGDVFTVQLGGCYTTFLQDPLSFGAIVKEPREKLDNLPIIYKLLHRLFGYVSEVDYRNLLQVSRNKYLKGDSLKVLTQAMMDNFHNLMSHEIGSAADQSTWKEDELFMFSYNMIFRAGYLSLFGNASPKSEESEEKAKEKDRAESEALFKEFHKYDQLFPDMVYGVLSPRERLEVKRLKEVIGNTLSVQKMKMKNDVNGWILDNAKFREENGMKESMINRYMIVLLWATQGNTGPASFWLLLFLMKHPEAMRAVKEEIVKVLKESGQEVRPGGPPINLTYEMLMKIPILESAFEETLRLCAAPVLTRAVTQDMTLKMADGREYFLRKGDRLATFPFSALHTDPEIHPDPQSFKYDRFLNPDGSKKTDFYKNGQKLKFHSMPWGSGVFICPGRFFASSEIKQFVFLVLAYFEIELKNPEEKLTDYNHSRLGIGFMQPNSDVQIRYRPIF